MKFKLFHIIVLLLTASCSKDKGVESCVQVKLALPCPATKVALGEEETGVFPLIWEEGDRVSLNGVLSNPMSAGLAGKSNAAFSFANFAGTSPYHLLYPGAADEKVILDGKALPMYASGTSLDQVLILHHLCCGVRLSLTGDLPLASMTLSALGDQPIAGTFTPSFADGCLASLEEMSEDTISFEL